MSEQEVKEDAQSFQEDTASLQDKFKSPKGVQSSLQPFVIHKNQQIAKKKPEIEKFVKEQFAISKNLELEAKTTSKAFAEAIEGTCISMCMELYNYNTTGQLFMKLNGFKPGKFTEESRPLWAAIDQFAAQVLRSCLRTMKSMANFATRFSMIGFSISSYNESRRHGMKYMQAIKPIQSEMAELVSIKTDLKDGLNKLETDIGNVICKLFEDAGGGKGMETLLNEERELRVKERNASEELLKLENETIDTILKEELAMIKAIGTLEGTKARKELAEEREKEAEKQAKQHETIAAEYRKTAGGLNDYETHHHSSSRWWFFISESFSTSTYTGQQTNILNEAEKQDQAAKERRKQQDEAGAVLVKATNDLAAVEKWKTKIELLEEQGKRSIENKKNEIKKIQSDIKGVQKNIRELTQKTGACAENTETVLNLCTQLKGNGMSIFKSAAELTSHFAKINDQLETLVLGNTSKKSIIYREGGIDRLMIGPLKRIIPYLVEKEIGTLEEMRELIGEGEEGYDALLKQLKESKSFDSSKPLPDLALKKLKEYFVGKEG